MRKIALSAIASIGLLLALPCQAQGAGGDEMRERMAALKESMTRSQQALRAYQWVEATTVSVNGEQKSFQEKGCYYGADGALQKTPIASSPPPKKQGGLRGAMMQKKKEEMTHTMQKALALVKTYVPPDPALLQRAVDAGKASVQTLEPGRVVRMVFRDYEQPGDSLGITLDLAANRVLGVNITSWVDTPATPVSMTSSMGTLVDGTTYTARTELVIPSEKLVVTVVNTGYRKM